MSNKKDEKKSLQKRLTSIEEIYIEQKGKQNKILLKAFIDEKLSEIITYRNMLKELEKKQTEETGTVVIVAKKTLQPSAALLKELNHEHNGNGEVLRKAGCNRKE